MKPRFKCFFNSVINTYFIFYLKGTTGHLFCILHIIVPVGQFRELANIRLQHCETLREIF